MRQASSEEGMMSPDLKIEVQKYPKIEEFHTFVTQNQNNWTTPILSFVRDGQLPIDIVEAKKVKKWAARFTILNDALYKRGFSIPYLKCVEEDEAKYIMEEVHEGICGDHMGPRSLASKIVRTGYF